MAHYLITGGCGFIGSHLAERLIEEGQRVRILDDLSTGRRENAPDASEIIVGDIRDTSLLKQCLQDTDGCFHLAAVASVERSSEAWSGVHEINQTAIIRLFESIRALPTPIPVVYASSAAVYGDQRELPIKETMQAAPLSAYGADKRGCELHARVAALQYGIPTLGLRFFNVYGPRQDPTSPYSGVISRFIHKLHQQEALTIHGDGQQTRDFVHVSDVVAGLALGMQYIPDFSTTLNICSGTETSISTLVDTLQSVSGTQVNHHHTPARPGDIRRSYGSYEKANEILQWEPVVSLTKGLRELWKHSH